MPKKKSKLAVLAERIAIARRFIDQQQALLEILRISKQPTQEAEGALRTYVSSLLHLLAYQERLRLEAQVKKGETKKGR
jgi:hypothetical protein